MTNPQSSPVSSTPSEPLFRHGAAGLALVLLTLGVMFMQAQPRPAPPEDASQTSPQLLLTGRYLLGWQAFSKSLLGDKAAAAARSMEAQLNSAQSHVDRLSEAILMAELVNPEKGLAKLDQLIGETGNEALRDDAYIFRKIYVDGSLALRESEMERIRERHGWFADLALSFGESNDHPSRVAVLAPARKTLLVFIAAFMGFGLMGLVGLGLFIFAALSIKKGKIKAAYATAHGWAPLSRLPYLEAMAWFMLVFPLGAVLAGFLPRFFMWLPFGFAMLTLFWIRFRGVPWPVLRRELGWHSGRGIFREIFSGVVGYLAGLPILAVGFVTTMVIINLSGAQPSHPIVNQFQDAGAAQILGLIGLACIAAPVVEETLFRGVFYHYLRGFGSALASALGTGLVFAAIHPQGLATIPVLCSIGVVFALLREWRDSLIAAMIAHACNNFAVLCLVAVML